MRDVDVSFFYFFYRNDNKNGQQGYLRREDLRTKFLTCGLITFMYDFDVL